MVLPVYTLLRASILDFRPRVANRCSTIVAAVRNGFACGDRRGCDVPRPILIFVASKRNSFACYDRRDNGLPCPILIFVAAKRNGPPAA